MKSPVVLLRSLIDDVKRLHPSVKGLDRDFITIKNRFEHEGMSFLSYTLPILCDALETGLATGRFACPTSFSKGKKTGALPKLLSGLLCNVFDNQGLLKDDPEVPCYVKTLREILRLFKKVVLTPKRSKELHNVAVRSFRETDDAIRSIDFDPRMSHHLSLVCNLVLPQLGNFQRGDELDYRHGPGGVFEGFQGNEKWEGLVKSLRFRTTDPVDFGFGEFLHRTDAKISLRPHPQGLPFGGKSKFHTVPKSAIAVRAITIEPLLNQFVQQGLNGLLRDSIMKCPVLSRCLDLTDQSKNQKLAMIGSRDRSYATIDLSSASDLLSLKLVKLVFGKYTDFLGQCISYRSNIVEVDKVDLPMLKYAGMGNATTFPVQSVVFAVLCIAAITDYRGKVPTMQECKRAADSIRVFGDDIIVKSEYYHSVERWITCFGLRLNKSKTFSTGNFRESCGLDAYMGVDVTPVYVRVDPSSDRLTASDLSSLVSTSNQLWLRGLYKASNTLRELVESRMKVRLPLVSPQSGLLGWSDRYGTTTAHGWDSKLHCLYTSGPVVVAKKRKDKIDGYPALLKSFLTPLIQRGREHLTVSEIRFKTRISRRRVPANAGKPALM